MAKTRQNRQTARQLALHSDRDPQTGLRRCQAPGCAAHGEFRAPKSRETLRDYYWFCLDHVRTYNGAWDYFKGMSQGEIERHMYNTMIWDRPTWHSSFAGTVDARLKQRIYERFMDSDAPFADFSFKGGDNTDEQTRFSGLPAAPAPEIEALAVMGLSPPVDWDRIRARYKHLAKAHHPDRTGNDKTSEELLKKINLAYSVLKVAWHKYADPNEEQGI